MKQRVYIDTSVIGGCLDEEFEEASGELVARFKRGEIIAVVSEVTMLEIKDAPEGVQAILAGLPEETIEHVELTEDAEMLAHAYISEGAIGEASLEDAEHVAIATVQRVDVLVSWNFRHIVNLERIRRVNAVNLKMGYPLLEIRSPREVVTHEGQEEIRRGQDDA